MDGPMRPTVLDSRGDSQLFGWRRAAMTLLLLMIPAGALAGGTPIPGTSTGTGEKPQSKLWWADQTWWAILSRSGHGLHFYEFDMQAQDWQPSAFMDADISASGRADVKWNGNELFVLAYSSSPKLYKYTYDSFLRTWNLESGFPVRPPISSGHETMVIDQDTTGRLWTSWEGSGKVWVAWSTSADHKEWSDPLAIRSGVDSDDITSVLAFGSDIGVFWSDENRDEFGFRVHHDSDPPQTWDAVEIADAGSGHADDHICAKASSSGKVFVVSKDDNDKMRIHRRDPDGDWTTKEGVISGTGTRGSLMICDESEKLYVAYTSWSSSSNKIKLRRASYSSMSFSTYVTALISGGSFNNATGCKQVLPQGAYMGMAGGEGDVWWNGWGELPPDGPPPPAAPEGALAALREVPREEILNPELHMDMPMDEASGATTADISRYAHEGELQGDLGKGDSAPVWTSGQSGSALQFTGGNWVAIESTPSLAIAGSFTIEAWVRRQAAVSGNGTILSKGRSNHRNYQLLLLENGKVQFKWEVSGGNNRGVTSAQALSAGTWQHVTAIYDKEAGRSHIYLDGNLSASAADSGTPVVNDEPLHLGRRISGSTPKEYLIADLDGIRIWKGVAYANNFTPGDLPVFPSGAEPAHTVSLQWTRPADEEGDLTYSIAMQTNGSGWMTLARDLTSTHWTHGTPVFGETCYEIRATRLEDGRISQPERVCIEYTRPRAEPKRTIPDEPMPGKAALTRATTLKAAPNPFNPQTQILLQLPQSGHVDLAVFDVRGRLVRNLHRGALNTGNHQFPWDARTDQGNRLASGVYFLRGNVLGEVFHKRLILLK